jgi:prophage regulatory protein
MTTKKPKPSITRAEPKQDVSDPVQRLISIDEVMDRVGIQRSTIYALVGSKAFPPPVKIGRASRWLVSEVDAFILKTVCARSP